MLIQNLLLYIVSFVAIWFGAGLIISSVSKFSNRLRLSPFAFSFVFLGILTSTPEFSVGLQSVAGHQPEIFVGNLLGGIIVLFLVIIPLLAIFGNGINLKHELNTTSTLVAMFVIILPSIFVLDKQVNNYEGIILILSYLILLFIVERKNGIFDDKNTELANVRAYSYKDLFKILAGIGIVFLASSEITNQTTYFASYFNIAPFYIGLLVIALGTDIPELSLAVRSIISGKREVAMGDYIGAAAASTLLFGILTLLNQGEVLTVDNFYITFIFTSVALSMFFFFFQSKKYISRTNGLIMIGVYILFVVFELAK